MEQLRQLLEEIRPGAAQLISVNGPQVPVAYKMSDSALMQTVGTLSRTPLREGVRATIEAFEHI